MGGRGLMTMMKLKGHYELFPLVTFVSGVCVMAGAFSAYALFKKTDVAVFRKSSPHPWINVRESQPQKLMSVTQRYTARPLIEELQKEVGSRKY